MYDIKFKVKINDPDVYIDVWDCHTNITWYAREMIEVSTKLPWLDGRG